MTRCTAFVVQTFLDEPGRPRYGREFVESYPGPGALSAQAVSQFLTRLEDGGLADSWWEQVVGGPPSRHWYRLTDWGVSECGVALGRWFVRQARPKLGVQRVVVPRSPAGDVLIGSADRARAEARALAGDVLLRALRTTPLLDPALYTPGERALVRGELRLLAQEMLADGSPRRM